jgi:hypothetical protein
MIIDFHTHVLSPEDQDKYTTSRFHQTVLASRDFGRRHPATIENVLDSNLKPDDYAMTTAAEVALGKAAPND